MDPTRLALKGSTWRREELPEPFCLEAGRRLLIAELEFSEWVTRRVEKIDLSRDRSVSRDITLEFSVRDDAPEFGIEGGGSTRLVPLSMMRRRTLVNMRLRDEHDDPVSMPGLRLTQQLDQSILLAAAATVDGVDTTDPKVLEVMRLAVCGDRDQIQWAYRRLLTGPEDVMKRLREDPLFRFTADRLMHNFSLFTFVPVDDSSTRRTRMIRMSFDEPTDWKYQKPTLELEDDPQREAAGGADPDRSAVYRYEPGKIDKVNLPRLRSAFGIDPLRMRFQTPGAEFAASYHFEIQAPSGVHVVKAALLAGRPNNPHRHTSQDEVIGHTPVVGLHAVEIPNGSLCRVQVDLGVPLRGWLATVWISTIAICGVLLSVALHWHSSSRLDKDQITNVVLILVTTSAGVATLVAQRDSGVLAARLVAGLRTVCTALLVLPLVVAGLLTYSGLRKNPSHLITWAFWGAFGTSLLILAIVSWAGIKSFRIETRSLSKESPWDQTRFQVKPLAPDTVPEIGPKPEVAEPDYLESMKELKFNTPAVGVRSAEGWHERYFWNDKLQERAVARIRALGERLAPELPTVCNRPTNSCGTCPRSCATTTSVGVVAEEALHDA